MFLVIKFGVDIPFQDEWNIATLFYKHSVGALTFGDLIAQHNESRPFVPRLLILIIGNWTSWDIRIELLIIQLFVGLIALNTYLLARGGDTDGASKGYFLTFLSMLLLFTLRQWWNFLMGLQFMVFIPPLCLTTCLLISRSKLGVAWKMALCIALCTVSTFSYANGMILWFLVPVALFFDNRSYKPSVWLPLLLACVVSLWVYFRDYEKPRGLPELGDTLEQLLELVPGVFSYAGSALSKPGDPYWIAVLIGSAIVALFIGVCCYAFVHRSHKTLLQHCFPWLILGAYSLISGLVATVGRIGLGTNVMLVSKYVSFSVFTLVALLHLVPLCLAHYRGLRKARAIALTERIPVALVTAFLVLHTQALASSVMSFQDAYRERLQGKAATLLINHVESVALTNLHPTRSRVTELARLLDSMDMLRPPLFEADLSGNLIDNPDRTRGVVDQFITANHGALEISGWAYLPSKRRPADAVFVTTDVQSAPRVLAIAFPETERPDVAKEYGTNAALLSGWTIVLPQDTGGLLRYWALDAETGRAFLLRGP